MSGEALAWVLVALIVAVTVVIVVLWTIPPWFVLNDYKQRR